jgi:transketolase
LHDLGMAATRPDIPESALRRSGSPAEHQAAHGLDAAGLRTRISSFLAL